MKRFGKIKQMSSDNKTERNKSKDIAIKKKLKKVHVQDYERKLYQKGVGSKTNQ